MRRLAVQPRLIVMVTAPELTNCRDPKVTSRGVPCVLTAVAPALMMMRLLMMRRLLLEPQRRRLMLLHATLDGPRDPKAALQYSPRIHSPPTQKRVFSEKRASRVRNATAEDARRAARRGGARRRGRGRNLSRRKGGTSYSEFQLFIDSPLLYKNRLYKTRL